MSEAPKRQIDQPDTARPSAGRRRAAEGGAGSRPQQAEADARAMRSCAPLAELDNVRKRAQRDIENAQRFALERFAGELLACATAWSWRPRAPATADAASLAAGQQATLQLLAKAFEKFSIQRLDPQGEPSIRQLHEAMMMQESADARRPTACCRCCSRATSSMAGCCGRRGSWSPAHRQNRLLEFSRPSTPANPL